MNDTFRNFALRVSNIVGRPYIFFLVMLAILIWAVTGPIFHFSDTWQLVINTGTTIVTFLMVFLIQNTQNRETKAINLKLDELLKGVKGARTSLVNLENMSDEEIDSLQEEFEKLHEHYAKLAKTHKLILKHKAASRR